MLRSINDVVGSTIQPVGESIGSVKEAYFDDQSWTMRYLVVDTGSWLADREVLISPYSVRQPLGDGKTIDVSLTREQVENSPPIDTHLPVSRQQEREYLGYYGYPEYWGGGDLWAMGAFPLLPDALPAGTPPLAPPLHHEVLPEDVHLRSTKSVTGYDIQATDASIGHVKDFIFDDASWAIRYIVIDTRNWLPGGRKVLLAPKWIDHIEWSESKVYTTLTREGIKASPEFDDIAAINRDYEERLHRSYGRDGYWL